MSPRPEAVAAADWWAAQLARPARHDVGDAQANAVTNSVSELVQRQRNQGQIAAIREALVDEIEQVAARAAVDPKRLTLVGSLPADAPARWARRHGYRCLPTMGGVIVQRGYETPIVAGLGDTLLWDGERITLLERP